MNLPLWAICSITVSCLTVALAAENPNSKKNNPKNPLIDDLTIDDEDNIEGSGYEESRDLESSGSGYGPDDEDATAHGSDTKSKPSPGRGSGLIPRPVTSVPSSSSPPNVKHLPESLPGFDENTRINPVETVPNENKNILRNNPDGGESDTESRSLFPKEPIDNHHPDDKIYEENKSDVGVSKVNTPDRDRATSFFAQPGILAAVIGGAVVGLLCAILVVMFIVYRMRKKDEGSYPLEEMKRCPASNPYMKPNHREFFA